MIKIRTYGKEKIIENLEALRRQIDKGRLMPNDEAFNPIESEWVPLRYVIEDAEENPQLEALLNEAPPVEHKAVVLEEADISSIEDYLHSNTSQTDPFRRTATAERHPVAENSSSRAQAGAKAHYIARNKYKPEVRLGGSSRLDTGMDATPDSVAGSHQSSSLKSRGKVTGKKTPANGSELFFWQSGMVIILALIFFAPLGIVLLLMRPRIGLLGNPLIKAILILGFASYWAYQFLPEDAEAAMMLNAF